MTKNTFKYENNMKLDVITQKVQEMIEWMKTDDYFKTHGGNSPNWNEGGELMTVYLKTNDKLGVKREDTLVIPYNKVLMNNLGRRL